MICRKTMMPCQTPSMCTPFGGCQPDTQQPPVGWKCPVCGCGNAPWQPTCASVQCALPYQVTCSTTSGD